MANSSIEARKLPSIKKSKPEKVGNSWRIRRHDGELVGWYASKALAQRAIAQSFWLL
jgi:hypothetical protein